MEGEDGKWYFSVYDFINFVTGHELSSSYARTLFCRLVKDGSEHANEVATDCSYFQFPCQGQKSTPCMTIRGLQRLLMILTTILATNPDTITLSRHSNALSNLGLSTQKQSRQIVETANSPVSGKNRRPA